MILYHGSTSVVVYPDVRLSRSNLDFGRGFYLTSYCEQAETWAARKAFLENVGPVVNQYEVEDNLSDCRVLRFPGSNEEWVEFVCSCRRGETLWQNYDLIVGGVADDKVYYAVDMYYQGLWNMAQTLEALKFYKVNDQWCFVNQEVLNQKVRFMKHWAV